MTKTAFLVLTALAAALPHPAVARPWGDDRLQVDTPREAAGCSDLNARANGELVRSSESFRLSKQEAPVLGVRAGSRTVVHVHGWNGDGYEVEACRFAAGADQTAANQTLRSIAVARSGAEFSATGPGGDSDWQVVFFVRAPRDAALHLESRNGPIDASEVNGALTVRALNGPIALDQCAGTVDAETTNGPIAMHGGSGNVRLRASNGPITLQLTGNGWSGSGLDVSTQNGPLSVALPSEFTSGIRIETSGHAPMSCTAEACRNARTEGGRFFPSVLVLNSGSEAVRISTSNGPVAVDNGDGRARAF